MKTRIQFTVCMAALFLSSCQKESQEMAAAAPVTATASLQVPEDFNWSASLQGRLEVRLENPENISVDQESLYLMNDRDEVLQKTTVLQGRAAFDLQLPAGAQYFLYYPYSGDRMAITGSGSVAMPVSTAFKGKGAQSNSGGSCTVCDSPIENNLAEQPVIPNRTFRIINQNNVPGWSTTASDGGIEIWSNGFNSVPAIEGRQFFEINANRPGALYQTLCLEPGSTIKWSVYHRGRAGTDVAEVRIGASVATATFQATMTTGNSAWKYYSGSYQVPVGQSSTVFVFDAKSTAGSGSVGNFLDNFRIICDADRDGVVDSDDDFPQDSTRAFASRFPQTGKQVLAFEDLWPHTGDYDFNDLVLSQQVQFSQSASGRLVDADFKVSLDAIGAGLANGVALLLRDANGNLLNNNIVRSTAGDLSADNANTNGFILTSNVFQSLSAYYQNNGVGPTQTPDTLRFSLRFNDNAPNEVYPELYLFRSARRGLEVHRPGFSPSAAFDNSLRNSAEDRGNFKTATHLPWALELITDGRYSHPVEKIDMVAAFPQFQLWASSGGSQNTTWYLSPDLNKVFDGN